ncbi:MAG: polysaccharide biosynthesis protein [Clostridia bacterium]|nr:polysaccharide biosynthesis protein [Clostridia bacterium]
MKNEVLKGSLVLIIAGVLGKILGAVYRIPLSNILGAEGIGVYQMIFPIFSLALIISSGGVSVTLSHLIAKARASGEGNIKSIFLKGLFYSLLISISFAILFFGFSDLIANLQGNILAKSGYKIVGIALIFSSLIAPFRGLFQGYQQMTPTAVSQVLEQFFKLGFGLVFAFYFVKTNIEFGVVGAFLGIGIAEIIAFLYMFFKFLKRKKEKIESKQKLPFAKTNITITFGFLIIPIITAFDSFAVINLLKNNFSEQFSTSLYGLQSGMVNSLINFPVVISVAISMSLLPSLSYLISQNKTNEINQKLKNVFNIIWILLMPCIVGFVVLAPEIVSILYVGIDEYLIKITTQLLQISAFEILFISILQISTSIFQSLEKPAIPIYILVASGLIKIVLTFLLVENPAINIYGLAIANLVFYALAGISSLYFAKKTFKFFLPIKTLVVSFTALATMGTSFYFVNVFISNIWAKLLLTGLAGIVFYIIPILVFDLLNIKNKFVFGIKTINAKKEQKNE